MPQKPHSRVRQRQLLRAAAAEISPLPSIPTTRKISVQCACCSHAVNACTVVVVGARHPPLFRALGVLAACLSLPVSLSFLLTDFFFNTDGKKPSVCLCLSFVPPPNQKNRETRLRCAHLAWVLDGSRAVSFTVRDRRECGAKNGVQKKVA